MKKIRWYDRKFRFCAFDGSSIQALGTDHLQYRLDLVTLEFTHLLVIDKRTYEHLKNYPLSQGSGRIGTVSCN